MSAIWYAVQLFFLHLSRWDSTPCPTISNPAFISISCVLPSAHPFPSMCLLDSKQCGVVFSSRPEVNSMAFWGASATPPVTHSPHFREPFVAEVLLKMNLDRADLHVDYHLHRVSRRILFPCHPRGMATRTHSTLASES